MSESVKPDPAAWPPPTFSRKRRVPVVVISDVHLGTSGCHAKGEVIYLNSGNWVENLTALEYSSEAGWPRYFYNDDPQMQHPGEDLAADAAADTLADANPGQLLARFKLKS